MESVALLLSATAFSYLLNQILLRFSYGFGVQSRLAQNAIRWGSTSKPTTGGISFYITFLIAVLMLVMLAWEDTNQQMTYLGLIVSATMAFLIGFADDAYGTHPWWKLSGQIAAGIVLILFGVHIRFFSLLGPLGYSFDYLLTIFWVVGIMNSLNMLDNMDGVTTTVSLSISLVALPMIVMQEGLSLMFFIMLAVCGALIGFLFWNWRPARIYMGDTGSMFIGMFLAYVGIRYFWNVQSSPDNISLIRNALIPILVFLATIMDTTMVTIGRISRGVSPFLGGRDHLTHNLVRVGMPEALVPITMGLVTLAAGSLAIFAWSLIPEWSRGYSLLFGLFPVFLVAIFGYLYHRGSQIEKAQQASQKSPQIPGDREKEVSRRAI